VACDPVNLFPNTLLDQLEHHLSVLRHEKLITTWHKRQIAAGDNWQRELDHRLRTASLILLLISPDFLASDYLYGVELQQAMQRHEMNEACVIPILLRPCDWAGTPFEDLQIIPRSHQALTQWDNLDAGFAEIAKDIRTTLKTMHQLTMNAASTTLPKIWQIPFARNPFFTGREQLRATQATAISQPQAINGLGGIGKTQLAIEYAYRYGQEYQVVLWARAETTEALNTSYTEIARLLNLPERDAQEQEMIVQAVKAWLRGKSDWLLILDNADDLNLVQSFLPVQFVGHLLLTTRAQVTGKLARRLEVDTLDRKVGALLLLRRAGLVKSNALFDAVSSSDQSMALALTEELGGLPLALDQAGAYIEETQCSLANYQQQYQTRRAELLAHRGMLVDDHPEPVATTWSLSFAKVEAANPIAAELLRICAFLAPDAIPEELLIEALKTPLPASEEAGSKDEGGVGFSPISAGYFDKAVTLLRTYSLVQRNGREQTLSVHRLVQAVVRDAIEEQTAWITRVIGAVSALFPAVSFDTWERCARYLPQALVCDEWMAQRHLGWMAWTEAIRAQ